jgi:Domain of unknown function (DUF4382)
MPITPSSDGARLRFSSVYRYAGSNMSRGHRLAGLLALTLIVAGCSGGGSGASATGPFSLQVVDAPLDPSLIDRVCIAFSAITVHYAGNPDARLDYEPLTSQVSPATHCTSGWDGTLPAPPVRLDALSGALTVHLVDSLEIPTGRATWIRLHFADGSYVVENGGGVVPLQCPSCEITDNNTGRGFKLNRTFEVTSAGLSLIADVDLRQSLLHENAGGYVLRPTVRVELNSRQGTISGSVAGAVITDRGGTAFTGGDTDTGCAVYVFPDDGSDLDDFHYGSNDQGSNVVTTASVRYIGLPDPDAYAYAAGALPVNEDGTARNYRVALTCDLDDPLTDDDGIDVFFTAPVTTSVSAGQTSDVDFMG